MHNLVEMFLPFVKAKVIWWKKLLQLTELEQFGVNLGEISTMTWEQCAQLQKHVPHTLDSQMSICHFKGWAWPRQHCGPSWHLLISTHHPLPANTTLSPTLPIPQTLHRGSSAVAPRLHRDWEHLATFLGHLLGHQVPWAPEEASPRSHSHQLRCDHMTTGFFLPSPQEPGYWDINWNTDYKSIFLHENWEHLHSDS